MLVIFVFDSQIFLPSLIPRHTEYPVVTGHVYTRERTI